MCSCRAELDQLDFLAGRRTPGCESFDDGYQAGFQAALQEAREIHESEHDDD